MLAPNTDNLRWMVDDGEPSFIFSHFPVTAREVTYLVLATSGAD